MCLHETAHVIEALVGSWYESSRFKTTAMGDVTALHTRALASMRSDNRMKLCKIYHLMACSWVCSAALHCSLGQQAPSRRAQL